jgi:hypothetical protein
MTNVSLLPTLYYHSEFQYLEVSIAYTSNLRVSSMFLLLSIGNYNIRRRCALKDIIIFILWFAKTVRMVQMYKCKRQTNNGTRTPWGYKILYFRIFSFPARQPLAPCLSMLSVCPLASTIVPVDWFSWYKNLIYLKVTTTPYFKFYFPSISNNNMADTKVVWR